MTPKRDPRSTPKPPKTDIKIELNFDAKTKRAGHGLADRLWAGTAPGGLLDPPGTHAHAKKHKNMKHYTRAYICPGSDTLAGAVNQKP